MPSDVDPQILWETTKCAIRGFYISFSSTLAKARTHQFTQLENKIQSLQNLQKQHFTEQQATQLSSLKEEYDLLSHSKAEFILHRTRQKYYFESERPSHLLALRLKECESKAYISAINHRMIRSPRTLWQLMTYLKVFTQICIKPKHILMNQFVSSI